MSGVLEQALEALKKAKAFCGAFTADECPDTVAIPIDEAIAKLEEAIKRQGGPVAWRWSESNGDRWFGWTTDWEYYEVAKRLNCPIEYAYTSAPTIPAPKEYKRFSSAYEEGVTDGWNACRDEMLSAKENRND